MRAQIVKPALSDTVYTDERCFILEGWNSPLDISVSIAKATIEKGITTQLHQLNGCDEKYLVFSGKGLVSIGGIEPTIVEEGDMVIIPSETPQKIENIGDNNLVFYCICTPRFKPEYYKLLE